MAFLASRVKVNWDISTTLLSEHLQSVATNANLKLEASGIIDDPALFSVNEHVLPETLLTLPSDANDILLENSISPLPLHKTLVLLEELESQRVDSVYDHERVALAKALVSSISNLHFGPEVGVGPAKPDAPVIAAWHDCGSIMVKDIEQYKHLASVPAEVHLADARQLLTVLPANSVDVVITSPPYPNEKDYTRITRLETVLLSLINNKKELQAFKRTLMRSNTRNVYKGDDDEQWIAHIPQIHQIADAIEARRIELNKTSGFERLYAKVTKLYFGGIARHLAELRTVLRPGARLAYVVGDQASYLRILIQTGQLIEQIAVSLGYEATGIDLFRTRLSTATKAQLREEVVTLRWNG